MGYRLPALHCEPIFGQGGTEGQRDTNPRMRNCHCGPGIVFDNSHLVRMLEAGIDIL